MTNRMETIQLLEEPTRQRRRAAQGPNAKPVDVQPPAVPAIRAANDSVNYISLLQALPELLLSWFTAYTVPNVERPGNSIVLRLLVSLAAVLGASISVMQREYTHKSMPGVAMQFLPDPISSVAPYRRPIVECVGGVNIPEGWDLACHGWDGTLRSAGDRPIVQVTAGLFANENHDRLVRMAQWFGGQVRVLEPQEASLRSLALDQPGAAFRQIREAVKDLHAQQLVLWSDGPGVAWLMPHADAADAFSRLATMTDSAGRPADIWLAGHASSSAEEMTEPLLVVGRAGALSRLLQEAPCASSTVPLVAAKACLQSLLELSARNHNLPSIRLDKEGQLLHIANSPPWAAQSLWPSHWPWWSLSYDPVTRSWVDPSTGARPMVAYAGSGPQALRLWEYTQGRNNGHCGPFMCFPVYVFGAVLAGSVIGVLVGLCWSSWLQQCEAGRRVLAATTHSKRKQL